MNRWKPFLLSNVSLPVLLFMLKPMKVLELAPGAFADKLKASGALNDAFIVRSLANWGNHISRWNMAKPKNALKAG